MSCSHCKGGLTWLWEARATLPTRSGDRDERVYYAGPGEMSAAWLHDAHPNAEKWTVRVVSVRCDCAAGDLLAAGPRKARAEGKRAPLLAAYADLVHRPTTRPWADGLNGTALDKVRAGLHGYLRTVEAPNEK